MRLRLAAALIFLVSCGVSLAEGQGPNIAVLVKAARSGDEATRLRAIDTLGARTDASSDAVSVLSEQLKDPSALVRAHAAHALGQLGEAAKSEADALAPLIVDPDARVPPLGHPRVVGTSPQPRASRS